MTAPSTEAKLAKAAWEQAALANLRGKPLHSLDQQTLDGLLRPPLGTLADNPQIEGLPGQFPFTRGATIRADPNLPWQICQPVMVPDPHLANQHILQELTGGASGVQLRLCPDGSDGIAVPDLAALQQVLAGIDLEIASLGIDPSPDSANFAKLLVDHWQQSGVDISKTNTHFGFSPASIAIRTNTQANYPAAIEFCQWVIEHAPQSRTFCMSADLIHNAGATEVLELAWICAETVQTMQQLLANNLTPDQAASQIYASIAMDTRLHEGIAKLRAARRLIARVLEVFEVSEAARCLFIHAVSSQRSLSKTDPWVNSLRTSSGCFAAVLGGAQMISVTTFTARLGHPRQMARRLARNTQLVLAEECAAARVVDPAGGSHAHEQMTDQLARAAWSCFQDIEAQGGLLAVAENGWLEQTLSAQRNHRVQQIRTRKLALIGVSEYVNFDVELPQVLEISAPVPAANSLAPLYDAAEFETLAERCQKMPTRPQVFLASIGPVSTSAARTGFARHLLAAGGIASNGGGQWENADDMLCEFRAAGTPLVILCGSDALYQEHADEMATQLKEAGAAQVWIAGGPVLKDNSHFDGRIALGCDAAATLTSFLDCLGVPNVSP